MNVVAVSQPAPGAQAATLNRHGLAAYLHRGLSTVDRDIALRRLPRGFRIGRSRYWLRSEIDSWLQAGAPDQETWEARQKSARR
jgi:predicted DNA-binding transcriptional regulator AlpA